MSYQEKRSILNLISSVLISGIYFWYVFRGDPTAGMDTDELMHFWGKSILILIPVTIVAKIVIAIFFAVGNTVATREKIPSADERDKLIELKSLRNSRYMFGFGFILAMVALTMNMSVNVMFIVIVLAGMASEIIENLSQLYFYRKGV
ncbi:MAG: hypothetical protein HEP71_22960 [Roseivirga sp.]|nr:hypothetical protein [Roseivirga sp.]